MSIQKNKILRMLAVATLVSGVTISAAHAEDDHDDDRGGKYSETRSGENRGKSLQPAQTNAKFQQECTSCHIAYAPGLLPAASWRKLMAGLDKHFGSDASLDAQDNKEITAFLLNNASNRWSAPSAPLRITETAWFKRKHGTDEIPASVWKRPQVKSPANCAACHRQAERGNFNEDDIRIPK